MDIQVDSQNIAEIGQKIRKMLFDENASLNAAHMKCGVNGIIMLISGPLGVGKTTLIKHVLPEFQVASPSFLHMLIYGENGEQKFAHIDAYTLKSKEAFLALGIEELLHTHCIIIEWGQLVEEIVEIFDARVIKIEMRYENDKRYIKVLNG